MPPRGSGIVINIGANGTEAKEVLEMVQNQLRETGRAGQEAGLNVSEAMESMKASIAGAVTAVLPVAMIAEATDKIKELVGSSLELGESLQKASEKTGIAVETLSTLHYAADITGTDFDSLSKAAAKMGASIGNAADGNDKKASAFLKSLGLDAKELADRSDGVEIAFKKVSQAIAATESPARRLELANGLLKKGGQDMIPVFLEVGNNWDLWRQKAQAAGVFLDGPGAEALANTNQRMKDLKEHITGAGIALTEGMAPGLTQMLDIMSSGQGTMEMMKTWGNGIIRTLAAITGEFYDMGMAAEADFAIVEALIPGMGDAARKDLAAVKELNEESKKFWDIAVNGPKQGESTPFVPHSLGGKSKGFGGIENLGGGGKGTDGIARAEAALAEAQAEMIAKITKNSDDAALTVNEAWHKLMLESDSEYYAEKLRLELQSIDAEETAVKAKRDQAEALLAKQQGDKTLKRDKSGQSAEELATKRQIVALDEQINALETKRSQAGTNNYVEQQLSAQQARLATLRIAAQVEAETNTTITARLALMREENALAIQKAGKGTPEAAQLEALERVKEAKLEIADVDRQIRDIEQSNKDATGVLKDREEKDPRQRLAVTKEINQLNAQTAADLKDLVAQYDALAATLGGPFIQTAKQLHAEMDKLNTPNKKSDADFTKALGDGMESMAEHIANASLKGKNAFHDMAMGIEKDVIDLAIKLAMNQWLKPMLNGLFSSGGSTNAPAGNDMPGGFPAFADGGDFTGDSPIITGENGPELMFPKGPGTIMPDPDLFFPKDAPPAMSAGALSELSRSSAGGGAPNMTMNITNASSQPVTARQTGSSFDAETKAYVSHVILEDLQQGGPISSAFRSGQ